MPPVECGKPSHFNELDDCWSTLFHENWVMHCKPHRSFIKKVVLLSELIRVYLSAIYTLLLSPYSRNERSTIDLNSLSIE